MIENGTITVKDGRIMTEYGESWTFQFKHGQSFTIKGLPSGVEYTITESDNTGYTVTINDVTGSSTTNGITTADGVSVNFTNSRSRSGSSGGSSGGGVRQGTNSRTGAESGNSSSESNPSASDDSGSIINVDAIGELSAAGESNMSAILLGFSASVRYLWYFSQYCSI